MVLWPIIKWENLESLDCWIYQLDLLDDHLPDLPTMNVWAIRQCDCSGSDLCHTESDTLTLPGIVRLSSQNVTHLAVHSDIYQHFQLPSYYWKAVHV